MGVPKHTTPAPFTRYRRDDDTPDWLDPVRHDTPGFGARAKKTMPVSHQDRHSIDEHTRLFSREICWDCRGSGKSGAILYPCPVCGSRWTWAQVEARAEANNRPIQDKWGAIYLPCSDRCNRIPSNRIYKVYEQCPTCKGAKHHDQLRSMDELEEYIVRRICERFGINDATMPTPAQFAAGFAGSEPTAPTPPSAPLEHPAVRIPERFTPHVSPLSPDELNEF